jgi:hypothetical protein
MEKMRRNRSRILARMKLALLLLSDLFFTAAHAEELESTTPVPAKTHGENGWNGNFERIHTDLKKMDGKIDVALNL